MGRPSIRAFLVALICVLTVVSTSWGRSRASNNVRRGHPNDRLRMVTMASTRFIAIPVILTSYAPTSLIFRVDGRAHTRQAAGMQKPTTGGK